MAKHKYIETPEKMWSLFTDYKEKIKATHIRVKDWVGKDAEMVHREKERPLTMEGFENYCEDLGEITELSKYFANKDDAYIAYRAVCSRIRRVIRQDQIEGGMAGIYNPSITQRLNGLVERQETTFIEQPLFPDETDSSKKRT